MSEPKFHTLVLTSDKHAWLLRGFFLQWQKYGLPPAEAPMTVAGFTPLENFGVTLPAHAVFLRVGDFADYPVERWSDALIKTLNEIPENNILLLLEDYWLTRPINRGVFPLACAVLDGDPDALRFDVTSDRAYCGKAFDARLNHAGFDVLIAGQSPYQLSFQAGVWRKDNLLKILRPNENPWMVEIAGTGRVEENGLRVYGTFQWPMRYQIVMRNGKFERSGDWLYPPRNISPEDWDELDRSGCTQP